MNTSKDVLNTIKHAKTTAKELKRPYVCLDNLFYSLLMTHSSSLETVFSSLGFNQNLLSVYAYSFISNRKESKKPTTNLNKDVKNVLNLAENLKEHLEEEDISIETLLLSLISYEKKPKLFLTLLKEYEYNVEDYIQQIVDFIKDRPLSFNLHEQFEEEEQEIEENINYFDQFSENEVLDQFCTNLNIKAKKGMFDGLIDFDNRIEKICTVLCRTNKPNPILIGPAGGGKTASVEILAREIVREKVPEHLKNKVIFEVHVSEMVSGTEFRGTFEERLQNIIRETMKYQNIILFFDEIHTLIGAGGTGRKGDLEASNILKPYLARGEISCIGATTDHEYNMKLKKDAAFDRRFEKVNIVEPSSEKLKIIAPNIVNFFETKNDVIFYKDFCKDAIHLCDIFLPNRRYPDKFVDIVDHACAVSKLKNKTLIDKEILNISFKDKIGPLSDNESIKKLKKQFINPQSCEKLIEHLECFSKSLDSKNESPNCVFSIGNQNTIKNTIKTLELFLKKGGSQHLIFSAKSLKTKNSISGYSEDHLISLCQKVSILQSPVVIIKDIEEISPQAEDILIEILSEGKTLMDNGEEIHFGNVLFLLFGEESNAKSIGFSSKNNASSKVSKKLEKLLKNRVFVK